jgi:serine/threonine protein kinase
LLDGLREQDPLVGMLQKSGTRSDELPQVPVVKRLMRDLHTLWVAGSASAESDLPLGKMLRPPEAPDELGRLSHYRVLGVIGGSGTGVVFRAEDRRSGRAVALKVLRPDRAAGAGARERFRSAARAAAGIIHDHVVAIYEESADRGVPFLAMQLLAGESLEQRLRRPEPVAVVEALRIGREVAAGLDAAHMRNVIHRDLKPANIWLEAGTGRVKILDVGLGGDRDLISPGSGVPLFMSPEQGASQAVNARSDLYSLGCVLYRLTTRRVPFVGANKWALLHAQHFEKPRPPRTFNAELPRAFEALILRLLDKEPARRPASAREVIEAIAQIV